MSYFFLLLRHKFLVFLAGILYTKSNIFNLLIHDWSKFTPVEFSHYKRKHQQLPYDDDKMQAAWLHHQNFNPHHWEHWISRSGHGNDGISVREQTIAMPMKYVREMVADWMGSSRTYGHDKKNWPLVHDWYWLKNFGVPKMKGRLHPLTIKRVDLVFTEIHFKQTGIKDQKNIFSDYFKKY